MARVLVLELDDGRFLAESRAICTYLEGRYPEPNLMGTSTEERAFIEMADRQVEFHLLATIAHFIRHTHPGLATLEKPQFPDFGASQGQRLLEVARLGKFKPADAGLTHLAAWRDRVAARPSAQA
jgi:glutathione S-transferase